MFTFYVHFFQNQMSLLQASSYNSQTFLNRHKITHRKEHSRRTSLPSFSHRDPWAYFFVFASLIWVGNIHSVWERKSSFSSEVPFIFFSLSVHNSCAHLHKCNEIWWIVEKHSSVGEECHTCLWNARNLTLSKQESHSI